MSKSLKDKIEDHNSKGYIRVLLLHGVLCTPKQPLVQSDVYGQVMENTWDKLELQFLQFQQIVDQIINENQKNN